MSSMQDLRDILEHTDIQPLDTPLSQSAVLGFDTETTGVNADKDGICSATLVLRMPGQPWQDYTIVPWLINPHIPLSPGAARVNGFTDEYLQEHGAQPAVALKDIASLIDMALSKHIPLLAYNAPFDVTMLEGNLRRWNLPTLADRGHALLVVDPLVIDRAVSIRRGKRTLTLTTQYYGVYPHGDFHDATADTIAAVDLVEPLCKLHDQVAQLQLSNLMAWQREAHAKQQLSYQRWAQANGRPFYSSPWL